MTIELSEKSVEFLKNLLKQLSIAPAASDAAGTVETVQEILRVLEVKE